MGQAAAYDFKGGLLPKLCFVGAAIAAACTVGDPSALALQAMGM